MPQSDDKRQQLIVDTIDGIYRTIPQDYNSRSLTYLLDNKNQLATILNRFEDQIPPVLDIGHGWLPLIIKLDQKLNLICPTYTISQVKEKFGGLRYYAHPFHLQTFNTHIRDTIYDAFQDLVNYTEIMASRTCEICARPGELIDTNGWLKLRCDIHQNI